jgi:hypothetical protein
MRVDASWVNVGSLLAVTPYDDKHPENPKAILVLAGNVTIHVGVSAADAMTQLAEGFQPGQPIPINEGVINGETA